MRHQHPEVILSDIVNNAVLSLLGPVSQARDPFAANVFLINGLITLTQHMNSANCANKQYSMKFDERDIETLENLSVALQRAVTEIREYEAYFRKELMRLKSVDGGNNGTKPKNKRKR